MRHALCTEMQIGKISQAVLKLQGPPVPLVLQQAPLDYEKMEFKGAGLTLVIFLCHITYPLDASDAPFKLP